METATGNQPSTKQPTKGVSAMATQVASKSVSEDMDTERETANTVRFAGEDGGPLANGDKPATFYVPKAALDQIGNPSRIRVTIEAL